MKSYKGETVKMAINFTVLWNDLKNPLEKI